MFFFFVSLIWFSFQPYRWMWFVFNPSLWLCSVFFGFGANCGSAAKRAKMLEMSHQVDPLGWLAKTDIHHPSSWWGFAFNSFFFSLSLIPFSASLCAFSLCTRASFFLFFFLNIRQRHQSPSSKLLFGGCLFLVVCPFIQFRQHKSTVD